MKTTIKVEKEVEVKILVVRAGVRYWEDATIDGVEDENGDLVPCRIMGLWCPEIDIDLGVITNWKQGTTAEIHYKVCDCCGWELKDEKGEKIVDAEDGYVPSTLCPKDSGYGDYIIMDVDADGKIKDWDFDITDFLTDEND